MQSLFVLGVLGFLALAVGQASCFTNRDVYELVKAYGIESDDDDYPDEAISLPGDIDDDLDLDYLVKKLGLVSPKSSGSRGLGLWWHHKHHHHHHHAEFHCTCTKDDCNCCVTHKFSFFVTHYTIKACMNVKYNPEDHLFELDFTLNDKPLYKHEVNLDKVAHLCFKVPGLEKYAEVCLEVYDVDLSKMHACARLSGHIDLKVHKFSVHLKLGCFSVPTSDNIGIFRFADKKRCLSVEVENADSADMPERFRKLASEDSVEDDSSDEMLRFD